MEDELEIAVTTSVLPPVARRMSEGMLIGCSIPALDEYDRECIGKTLLFSGVNSEDSSS